MATITRLQLTMHHSLDDKSRGKGNMAVCSVFSSRRDRALLSFLDTVRNCRKQQLPSCSMHHHPLLPTSAYIRPGGRFTRTGLAVVHNILPHSHDKSMVTLTETQPRSPTLGISLARPTILTSCTPPQHSIVHRTRAACLPTCRVGEGERAQRRASLRSNIFPVCLTLTKTQS
jgi:hypothetical protein